jgi:hypothetical protein
MARELTPNGGGADTPGRVANAGRTLFKACDVQEVVLVAIGQIPFHLRRIYSSIGLSHVNGRDPQWWKDVARHPIQRCNGTKDDCKDKDNDSEGALKGSIDRTHELALL